MKRIKRLVRDFIYRSIWAMTSPVLKLMSAPDRVVMTCTRGDGGGAQWHGRFSVMTFADNHNMSYMPSDFDRVMPLDTFEIRSFWSSLFSGEYSYPNQLPQRIKIKSLAQLYAAVAKSFITRAKTLIDADHLHSYTDLHPEKVSESLKFHKLSYRNPAQVNLNGSQKASIAMHVRRGLSWEKNFTANRQTTDDEVLDRLLHVIDLEAKKTGVIYSGLPNEAIAKRLPDGFTFDSSSSEFVVIHHLITADVSILAKSCLSYVAGAFALGKVFYEPFFHPPLPQWEVLVR